jgi:YidC/Oxa1 family membrane protein insertase
MWAAFNNLLDGIMQGIQSFCRSYGWSVAVFTLFVRVVMLPFDYKQRQSMKRMQSLNPQLQAIQKKYANDKEKLQQKQAELYKKEKINPLSSCLPMLLSFPLLIAMFGVMRNVANEKLLTQMKDIHTAIGNAASEVEVHEALTEMENTTGFNLEKWLWVKNLWMADSPTSAVIPTDSAPIKALQPIEGKITSEELESLKLFLDSPTYKYVLTYPAFKATQSTYSMNLIFTTIHFYNHPNGWFLLPLIACITQFISTLLNPTDPNAAAQQDAQAKGTGNFMKYFFPLFSLYICATSNAAFSIYWVATNIIMIFSTLLMNWLFNKKDAKPKIT